MKSFTDMTVDLMIKTHVSRWDSERASSSHVQLLFSGGRELPTLSKALRMPQCYEVVIMARCCEHTLVAGTGGHS